LDSVKLYSSFAAGYKQQIRNDGAYALAVYPATNHYINGLAQNAYFIILPGNSITFVAKDTTHWVTLETGWQESKTIDLSSALTLVVGAGTLDSVQLADAKFYYRDGVWEFSFNGNLTCSATTRTAIGIAIAGINTVNVYQKIGMTHLSANATYGQYITNNSNIINVEYSSTTSGQFVITINRIKLSAKPTSYI
jgi:hypothetical protein